MIFVLLLLFLSAIAFWYLRKQRRIFKAVEHLPGPTPLPIFGNALDFITSTSDILPKLEKLVEDYGSVVRLCFGSRVVIVLTDPKEIGQVLTATDSFYKGDLYDIAKPFLGEGLITSIGETWHRHRKILNPAFNKKYLLKFIDVFNKSTNELIEQLKEQAAQSESVNIIDPIFNCAFNIICKTAMNVDVRKSADFQTALNSYLELFIAKYFSPVKRIDFIYRFTNDYHLEKQHLKTINTFTKDVIATRRNEFASKSKDNTTDTILDQLFNLSEENVLTDQEIRDEVVTFIFAGSDTVGTSVSLGLFELAKHPSVQKKIIEEVNNVSGTGKDGDIKLEGLHAMKYTDRVLKEILRLFTPTPFLVRTTSKEFNFGDFTIPPESNVMLFLRGAHLSEQVYPSPENFDPDRFLPENYCRDSFMPFGGGPRVCIGQTYGTLEAKLLLAKIIRNFELIPVQPEHKPALVARGILKPTNGLPIKLKIRPS